MLALLKQMSESMLLPRGGTLVPHLCFCVYSSLSGLGKAGFHIHKKTGAPNPYEISKLFKGKNYGVAETGLA